MAEWIAQLPGYPWLKILEGAAYLATALSIPWALLIYARDVKRQREEREVGTYSSLDDKYLHYLDLCMQRPELNAFVLPLRSGGDYTAEQKIQRYAMFETVISITERAYLRYQAYPSARREDQWSGWASYLSEWKSHPDFPELWSAVGRQFDRKFTAFVEGLPSAGKESVFVRSTADERAAAEAAARIAAQSGGG